MTSDSSSSVDPPRPWWQFSLRTLFIASILIAMPLAWLVSGPERQRRATVALKQSGATIEYEENGEVHWFLKWFPVEYHSKVHKVTFPSVPTKRSDLPIVLSLSPFHSLWIHGPEIDDESIELVAQLKIKKLTLSSTKVSPAGFAKLAPLQLEWIGIVGNPVTDDKLEQISKLTSLQMISFYDEKQFTDVGLAHLAKLTKLQSLDLKLSKISDSGLAHLASLTELETLLISSTNITQAGLAHLANLQKLKRLEADRLTDVGLEHVGKLGALERLELHSDAVTDKGMSYLAGLKKLRYLQLFHTGVTNRGFAAVRGMTALQNLQIHETAISDLSPLSELPVLKRLSIARSPIRDGDLAPLLKMASLEELHIHSDQLTDAGLEQIGRIKWLKGLSLQGEHLTDIRPLKLREMDSLERIVLSGANLRLGDFEELLSPPKLKSLHIKTSDLDRQDHLKLTTEAKKRGIWVTHR